MKNIGSDFIEIREDHAVLCSECGCRIPPHGLSLVSIKKGKVRKRVCSEDCRLEFDARFWQSIANVREPLCPLCEGPHEEQDCPDLSRYSPDDFNDPGIPTPGA